MHDGLDNAGNEIISYLAYLYLPYTYYTWDVAIASLHTKWPSDG